MPSRVLLAAVVLLFSSGCTVAANATPAATGALPLPAASPTPSPVTLAPAEAAKAKLIEMYGSDGMAAVVTSVVQGDAGVVVTLARPANTLGTAEQYWRICNGLLPQLETPGGSGATPAIIVAQGDGRVVVRATADGGGCSLVAAPR